MLMIIAIFELYRNKWQIGTYYLVFGVMFFLLKWYKSGLGTQLICSLFVVATSRDVNVLSFEHAKVYYKHNCCLDNVDNGTGFISEEIRGYCTVWNHTGSGGFFLKRNIVFAVCKYINPKIWPKTPHLSF